MSVVSVETGPSRCGQCQDAINLLGHLEENAECREVAMRERLQRYHWTGKYHDDRGLLLFDLSLVFDCCLNTYGCPLPDGVIERNSRHLFNSPACFQFYRDSTVLAELSAPTDTVVKLTNWLRNRRNNIREKKQMEDQSFSQMMNPQLERRCQKCGLQGPMLLKFEVKEEVRGSGRFVCKKPVCQDEERLIDWHPNTLSLKRGDAAMVQGEEDHLVAVRVDSKDAFLFMPAHLVARGMQVEPDEQIDGTKTLLVATPSTQTAMRVMENATKRAEKEWETLKSLKQATLAPRTMLLGNFGQFAQTVSFLHRLVMAAFRRSCLDKMSQMKHVFKGQADYSPMGTDAIPLKPKFSATEPQAIQDTILWSDSAQVIRLTESEARSACNGIVKTKLRIRILAGNPVLWSDKLKAIMAKSFGRDVRENGSGRILTCEGGCDLVSCGEYHLALERFLEEHLSGLALLARIPLVLNYMKAKVKCFHKTILEPECSQYDFKIEWDKFSWTVYLVGHMWSKKRQSLNEKVARNWYPTDMGIVRRVLDRPEVLETVSLEQGLLERR